ncbi:MAG: Lrp/AsnC family transcriptional regulator, partial [Alphaproteobacteria bacterium]
MPSDSYDPATLKLLDLLQNNAELSTAELAAATGLSASPCWRRINDLKASGVIKGTVALVDAQSLGLAVNVFVHISLKQQDRASLDIFDEAVRSMPEV